MSAIQRFNATILAATIVVMFCIIEYLLPLLSTIPDALAQYVPFVSRTQLLVWVKVVVTFLLTVGTYKSLSTTMIWMIDRIRPLKAFIFGPSYVEGTWIGRFMAGTDSKWTVEHFEQSLDRIVIRGCALDANGQLYASWNSIAVAVDPVGGVMTYTYTCDVVGRNVPQQGVAVFQFQRAKAGDAPYGITGYATDVTDGTRSPNDEVKVCNEGMSVKKAIEIARKQFP